MKNCKVLVGPILGNGEIYYNDGEEIILEDATATLFEGWKYVTILGDAEDGSVAAGRAAEPTPEPTPIESAIPSPLPGGDFKPEQEPEPEVKTTRKSRAA